MQTWLWLVERKVNAALAIHLFVVSLNSFKIAENSTLHKPHHKAKTTLSKSLPIVVVLASALIYQYKAGHDLNTKVLDFVSLIFQRHFITVTYMTVTVFARFLGLSGSSPFAMDV